MKNNTGKHINELIAEKLAPYKATIKQLSTKLKKANRELKLKEMEQLMDYYHIQRLENNLHQLKRKYYKNMVECRNELVVFQIGLIMITLAFIFYLIVR